MFSSPSADTWPGPLRPVAALGHASLEMVQALGRFGRFFAQAIGYIVVPPFKVGRLIDRIHFIGFRSLTIVILTGAFTGMVLGLQIFVTGLAGSALTAEIGIMKITEQIDALQVMALNPVRYLVVPAIVAGVITFPLLVSIFDMVGIFGGYLVGVELLGLSPGTYFGEMKTFVDLSDLMTG